MIRPQLFRLVETFTRDPAIDRWLGTQKPELAAIAQQYFEQMRGCGDEVREILHDDYPVACFGVVPFAYVNVFTAHINVGFFNGSELRDPAHLLEGSGKFMRHVKLKPGILLDDEALATLIESAYANIKFRVERGD